MNESKFDKLLENGLPKLLEQSIVIIMLVVLSVFLINDKRESAKDRNKCSEDLIEYLKTDHSRMIEAVENHKNALKDNNELLRQLIKEMR